MSVLNQDKQSENWQKRLAAWEALKDVPRQEDLLDVEFSNHQYEQVTEDEAQILAASGAYFGDEGKGRWSNSLAERVDVVARANSGPNTGRTIWYEGKKYIFHGVPSAVVSGRRCLIGTEVVLDPVSLLEEELDPLTAEGINYQDNLAVGNFHLITPYHRIMDILGSKSNSSTGVGIKAAHESKVRKTSVRLDQIFNSDNSLKSAIKKDMESEYLGFLNQNGLSRQDVVKKLEQIQRTNPRVVPQHVLEFAKAQARGNINTAVKYLVDLYVERIRNNVAFPKRTDVTKELQDLLSSGGKVLVETTQSFFLANNTEQTSGEGTSASTTAGSSIADLGIDQSRYKTVVINVFKFPGATRVGRGDIPASYTSSTTFSDSDITNLEKLGEACTDFRAIRKVYFSSIAENGLLRPVKYSDKTGDYEVGEAMAITSSRKFGEHGATTKKPRVCGEFDCVMAAQAARGQGKYAVISAFDRGDKCEKLGLTVGYMVHFDETSKNISKDQQGPFMDSHGRKYRNGDIIKPGDSLPHYTILEHCHKITKIMDGWIDEPIGASHGFSERNKIPKAAMAVVAAIEHYTGLEIIGLGNGAVNDPKIYIRKLKQYLLQQQNKIKDFLNCLIRRCLLRQLQ